MTEDLKHIEATDEEKAELIDRINATSLARDLVVLRNLIDCYLGQVMQEQTDFTLIAFTKYGVCFSSTLDKDTVYDRLKTIVNDWEREDPYAAYVNPVPANDTKMQ